MANNRPHKAERSDRQAWFGERSGRSKSAVATGLRANLMECMGGSRRAIAAVLAVADGLFPAVEQRWPIPARPSGILVITSLGAKSARTCFGAQRGLCSGHLAVIPGHSLIGARGSRSLDPAWSCSSVREGEKHEPGRWDQVCFRATADVASGATASGR